MYSDYHLLLQSKQLAHKNVKNLLKFYNKDNKVTSSPFFLVFSLLTFNKYYILFWWILYRVLKSKERMGYLQLLLSCVRLPLDSSR